MAYKQVNTVDVTYCPEQVPISVGRLSVHNRQYVFEYSSKFLETGLELSPFKLPLRSGILTCDGTAFDGLFGIFNDSLPDGWGRLLLDRHLMKAGIRPEIVTPLDRLCYVGTSGMGALQYQPAISDAASALPLEDLDFIQNSCLEVLEDDDEQLIDNLLAMNGYSAGARPKIMLRVMNLVNKLHEDWIVKFRSSFDPQDIGAVEYAYHLMAIAAGLDVPEARLFKSQRCAGYFGVKRFDRINGQHVHMHTISGLLHADHRIPNLDYETILKTTKLLTNSQQGLEQQFRNAAFNVMSYNRDDHAKNFSFLMDNRGIWRLSPVYDLTFSSGPAGEHATTVMGEGKNAGKEQLHQLAQAAGIDRLRAQTILDEVQTAVHKWPLFAEQAGLDNNSTKSIQAFLA